MLIGGVSAYNEGMTKGSKDEGVVIHAGFPNAAEDERFGSLNLDKLVVKHRVSTFFWRLETDVEERGWPSGSVLVVDRAIDAREGDMVVAVADDTFLLSLFSAKGLKRLDGEKVEGSLWGVVTYCIQPVNGR